MNPSPQKVLIIQTAFIGDVVLATPIAESIHKSYPEAEVDFLLRKGNEGLFEGHPFLSEILIWDKSEKYSSLLRVIKTIRNKKYDIVINLQRFFSSGLITYLSEAKKTVGFTQNPWSFSFNLRKPFETKEGLHECDRNLSLLDDLELPIQANQPRLYPGQIQIEKAKNLIPFESYITISPGSVWFTKQAPEKLWKDFSDKVSESIPIVFLGGPGDTDIIKRISHNLKPGSYIDLSGKTDFLTSACIMSGATMNYANDSAPTHFASSVNAPITSVFCSTIPGFGFGPRSENSWIVEKTGLDCKPCGLHGKKACPKGHFRCGNDLVKEDLLNTLNEMVTLSSKTN